MMGERVGGKLGGNGELEWRGFKSIAARFLSFELDNLWR